MTDQEARKLENGLYRIHWKHDGGTSLAAVGRLYDGSVWFAPTNWTHSNESGIIKPGAHRMIERVERLH